MYITFQGILPILEGFQDREIPFNAFEDLWWIVYTYDYVLNTHVMPFHTTHGELPTQHDIYFNFSTIPSEM